MDGSIMTTNGFYKYESETLFGPGRRIYNANYELLIEDKDQYALPIDGWYYFESEELAKEFFGIEDEEEQILSS